MNSKALLICLIVVSTYSIGYCQIDSASTNLPYKDGKVIYEHIVEVPGSTKATSYAAAKKWIADSFTSSKAVIQTEDVATGQIIGKGDLLVTLPKETSVWGFQGLLLSMSIQIDCKDEKFRVRVYDIRKRSPAVGMIAADESSIESFDGLMREQIKKKPNRKERWTSLVKEINTKLFMLTQSLSKQAKSTAEDTF
jgi:hypothetical protein